VKHIAILLAVALFCADKSAGAVVKRIVRAGDAAANLLKDDGWRTMSGGGRPQQLVCDNGADARAIAGFSQTITLNQTARRPIIATAWSRAGNVGGSRDSDYSLYLDILYTDGTPLWGQTASFRTGTHDWQKATVKVFPTKPIGQVAVHLLLRRHSGKAEFKDAQLSQLDLAAGSASFDGQAVIAGGKPVEAFAVRDVGADGDFVSFENGQAAGLKIDSQRQSNPGVEATSAKLTTTSDADRAVTLVYTLPTGGDVRWLAGPRRELRAEGSGEYADVSRCAAGNGSLSRYPFAAVARGNEGIAIGLDMAKPAVFRVGYSAGTAELYIAFDLGLTKEKRSADLSLCILRFDGRLGFRGAVDAYHHAYPEFFKSRTPRQGVWMPFGNISTVQGWDDFGFMFKEGNSETVWDDAHNILTFRYTEPMTWWMRMPKEMPRTLEAAEAHAGALARKGDASAKALFASGIRDEAGRLCALIRNEPWCDGAVWSMNSCPGITGETTDFRNKWNPALRDKLYGKSRRGDLDGEYIDSSEGYVTAELDFDRAHFAAAKVPLTFSADAHAPAVYRGLIAYEYVRALAEDLHRADKLTMANGTPQNLCWLAPYLDVMGTETDWKRGQQWRPMSDDDLMYRRILCGPKPYCFLMNTSFNNWTHDDTERFMKRCLAYGMFPGFFSANASTNTYFSQPALYNRDRDLFRKYIPLCRLVAEAGWRPITGAASSDEPVHVERFGEQLLTVYNDSQEQRTATITISAAAPAEWKDLLARGSQRGDRLQVRLAAGDVAVFQRQ